MIRRYGYWLRSHPKTTLGMALLAGLTLVNLLAYRHAHAMTHYAPEGVATAPPESLSAWQKAAVLFAGVTVPRPSARGISPRDIELPFTVHHFPTSGCMELEAWHVPNSKTRGLVLMFHGYAACKVALLREAMALYRLGYSLFMVDFRGSGGSAGSETTIGVREAEDVEAAVTYARAQWTDQPLILYGQSMGGAAILRALAVLGVRADAIILECPFDRLVNTVANRFRAMGVPAFPGAQLLVFWGGWQQDFNGFAHNPSAYAEKVACPTLVLHGAGDPRVTPVQARAVYDSLRGRKVFELLEDVGHESYVSKQPERWKQIVADFVSEYLPTVAP